MCDIAELTVLLRERVELPDQFTFLTEEFREGWSFALSGDALWMDKQIRTRGWHFIRIDEGSLKSGVGQTSQDATSSALKMALRCVDPRFNAAEVRHIELTKYPWFYLARVRVYPYQIQQGSSLSPSNEPASLGMAAPAV